MIANTCNCAMCDHIRNGAGRAAVKKMSLAEKLKLLTTSIINDPRVLADLQTKLERGS